MQNSNDKEEYMELRIKEIMGERNVTSAWLSAKAGVSKVAISNIITGKSSPSLDTLINIAKALDVDITTLLFQPTEQGEINGFVKLKGTIYEVRSFEDLRKLLDMEGEKIKVE